MRVFGQVTTTSASKVPVESTSYSEQTSGAQRSFKSSSASDTAAGTGVRKVKVTYYTLSSAGAITGPFTEIVTLAGTVAVPTVATNIALVEKIEAYAVGSGGVAAGTISMYDDAAGIGSVFASIATGAVRTFYAHHYVATGAQCAISDLLVSGGDAASATFDIVAKSYVTGVEQPIAGSVACPNTGSRGEQVGAGVAGPARVRTLVTPANTNSQVSVASFGAVDQVVVLGS